MIFPLQTDRYHIHGQSQGNPQHPWLLFLHGFLGDCSDFDAVMANLSTDFYCVSLDLPGHGETIVLENSAPENPPSENPYEFIATATGILQALDRLYEIHQDSELHQDRANRTIGLVGYSLGGRLALYLLLTHPQRFFGGVIESASPGLESPEERSQRLQQDHDRAAQLEIQTPQDFQAFLQDWYEQPLFYTLAETPCYPEMLRRRCKGNPYTLAQALRHLSLGAQPSLWDALAENVLPLRLVVGAEDAKFVALNQEMLDRCPHASLEPMVAAGHNCHFTHPRIFANIVRSFFLQPLQSAMTEPGYSLPAEPSHWEIWHLLKTLQQDHPQSFQQAVQDLFIKELQDIRMEAAELSQELARTEADLDSAERKLKLIRQVLDEPGRP